MGISSTGLSRRVQRAAAVLLVSVFATLPTLVRLHDRVTVYDDAGRFRLSKNIERAHERQAPATLTRVEWLGHDLAPAGETSSHQLPPSPVVFRTPRSNRAPPFSR